MVFKTDYRLMQVKSIAECSEGSILQYYRPSLSYQLSLRPLLCLFLSGCFTQVLLYCLPADDSYKISSLILDQNGKKYHKMC